MNTKIGYFSIEIAISREIPNYSGGLGILAGDTIRGCADRKVPMVAVTLLHSKGYFHQKLDEEGWQTEETAEWDVEKYLAEREERVTVSIEGRSVSVRAWEYKVKGCNGGYIPVYALDTDLPENTDFDRTITHHLYGGDDYYRLCQELVLGVGGIRILRALGYDHVEQFHMNEGHAALLVLELMNENASAQGRSSLIKEDIEYARRHCVFTTHTPVPAGHDQFAHELVNRVITDIDFSHIGQKFYRHGKLNMTYMALAASRYVNGVAKSHGEVSRTMFQPYEIDSITNGVHVTTWASRPFIELFDKYLPTWRDHSCDTFVLRSALSIPAEEIWKAHMQAKRALLTYVSRRTGTELDPDVFTIGFARRATAYKRTGLLFHDIERLKAISSRAGKLQVVYAGKAHPRDMEGKELIKSVFRASRELKDHIKIVYLPDYDWATGALMTSGVDLWLNTPHPPQEASGTSGMKAALNGVPSLSVLDGWWVEGCVEGKTGWAIAPEEVDENNRTPQDAKALYDKLEEVVLPLFYNNREEYIAVMSYAIALNGSFFNTHRMVMQYVMKAYFH